MNTTAPAGGLVGQHAWRLQVPHTRHVGWPFGNSMRGRPPVERRPRGHDRELADAERAPAPAR